MSVAAAKKGNLSLVDLTDSVIVIVDLTDSLIVWAEQNSKMMNLTRKAMQIMIRINPADLLKR